MFFRSIRYLTLSVACILMIAVDALAQSQDPSQSGIRRVQIVFDLVTYINGGTGFPAREGDTFKYSFGADAANFHFVDFPGNFEVDEIRVDVRGGSEEVNAECYKMILAQRSANIQNIETNKLLVYGRADWHYYPARNFMEMRYLLTSCAIGPY